MNTNDWVENGARARRAELVISGSPGGLGPSWTTQPSLRPPGDQQNGLTAYLHLLLSHKLILSAAVLAGVICGYAYFTLKPKVYRVQATIEFQDLNEAMITSQRPDGPGASYTSDAYIATQIRILQSESLLRRALETAQSTDPLRRVKEAESSDALKWKPAHGGERSKLTSAEPSDRLPELMSGLKVHSPEGTRIVEITCNSSTPQLAADFVNALIGEYTEESLEARWNAAKRTGTWLNSQMDSLREKVKKSDEELVAYARSAGLTITGEKENITDEKLRQLQTELSRAQADRAQAQSRYELTISSPASSLAEVLDHGPLRDYQVRLTDLRRQFAELSSVLTPAHRSVQRVQAQITELEGIMEKERSNVLGRIRNEYQAARQREQLVGAALARQTELVAQQANKMAQYSLFKREADSNRALYDVMLQKVKEYGITSALKSSHIRVIDPAKAPRRPYSPNFAWSTGLGLAGGLLVGMVGIVLRDHASPTFKAPGEASSCLNVAELGVIPVSRDSAFRRKKGAQLAGMLGLGTATNVGATSTEINVWHNGPSIFADSFRTTLVPILFSVGKRNQVIAVCSPGSNEGKTTATSNFGVALAEAGYRVLLLEGDLRKPRLHRVFGLPAEPGLADVLAEQDGPDDLKLDGIIRRTSFPKLSILTAGTPRLRTTNLLYSAELKRLLAQLRRNYDIVLIDTPPLLFLPDARILGGLSDSTILVLRAHQTLQADANLARQRLAEDGTPLFGVVLNHWDPNYGSNRRYDAYLRYSSDTPGSTSEEYV